jgi:predicted ATP-grasp superfamily ATP-dependent carboligase
MTINSLAKVPMPLRVLLSEGSSTSAREAITVLGLAGHHVEVCDPSPWALARFSRFVKRLHRCPPLRDDPDRYLAYIERLLASHKFDVLLPTHEQGFLFARVQKRLTPGIGLALPSFESYRTAHGKAGFSRLLSTLRLPQPATRIVTSERALREAVRLPKVVKTSIGTASRGIWFVREADDLDRAARELAASNAFAGEVLVQEWVHGTVEKAQSVFCRGKLLGFHAYRQVSPGVGGGEAIKESVSRPGVREMLARIGERLAWHGALSVDYLMPEHDSVPRLIDCNPRLVEPMSAYLAGTDLVGLLLQVSRGETPEPLPESRAGVRTHLSMQALLGVASRGGTRRDLLRECWRLGRAQAPYAGSREEMTPVRSDRFSAVPLALTAALLLARPSSAIALARGGFGAHLLSLESIRQIESEMFS